MRSEDLPAGPPCRPNGNNKGHERQYGTAAARPFAAGAARLEYHESVASPPSCPPACFSFPASGKSPAPVPPFVWCKPESPNPSALPLPRHDRLRPAAWRQSCLRSLATFPRGGQAKPKHAPRMPLILAGHASLACPSACGARRCRGRLPGSAIIASVAVSELELYRRQFEQIQQQANELTAGLNEARFNWRCV